jgi:pimeloyl-ACP methyl ester carboxylesterase
VARLDAVTAVDAPAPRRVVELPGGRQATYYVLGEGPPLLWFESGPGFTAVISVPDATALAARFTVYLIDPHGSGGSTPPTDASGYTPEGHARYYDEVRAALGIESTAVLGHSFGGSVALSFAAQYPHATEGCVVVSAKLLGFDVGGHEVDAERERGLARHAHAPWYPEARRV